MPSVWQFVTQKAERSKFFLAERSVSRERRRCRPEGALDAFALDPGM